MQALHAMQQFTPLWETLQKEFHAVTFATGQVCGPIDDTDDTDDADDGEGVRHVLLWLPFYFPFDCLSHSLRLPFHSVMIAFLIRCASL